MRNKFEVFQHSFKSSTEDPDCIEFTTWINKKYSDGEGYEYLEILGKHIARDTKGYIITLTCLFKIL